MSTLPNTESLQLEYGLCLLRAHKLGADCAPVAGPDHAIITAGAVSLQATAVLRDGDTYEWIVGNGDQLTEIQRQSKIRRWDITGQISTVDPEFKALLFGGEIILGDVGSAFAGETIGYAEPDLTTSDYYGVYLEVIAQLAYEGDGDCVTAASGPAYEGHIFPRVKLVPGDIDLQNAIAPTSFTGAATVNATAGLDPFGDYPGVGNPSKPHSTIQYSQAEFDAMLALAAPGTQTIA